MQTQDAYKIIFKMRTNLKRLNCVYMLSSKHTYRPVSAGIVAQCFYNLFSVFTSHVIKIKMLPCSEKSQESEMR